MKPPELSDEEKALLERMKKARAEAGNKLKGARTTPAAPAGTLADRWREPFGGEEGEGLFQPIPPGVATGVVAIDRDDGTVRYRDGRSGFTMVVHARARLETPPPGFDARLTLPDATLDIRVGAGADAAALAQALLPGAAVKQRGGVAVAETAQASVTVAPVGDRLVVIHRRGDGNPQVTF